MPFLRVVPRLESTEAPDNIPRGAILLKVLRAKLTPSLTVEQACHLDVPDLPDELVPRAETILADRKLLRAAGLDLKAANGAMPAAVVLADPSRFTARFPELSAAVPVLLACEGVAPYTQGRPRKPPKVGLAYSSARE